MNKQNNNKFERGNQVARKEGRKCYNYPFCKERILIKERPNKKHCSPTCKRYALLYITTNNLKKIGIKPLEV